MERQSRAANRRLRGRLYARTAQEARRESRRTQRASELSSTATRHAGCCRDSGANPPAAANEPARSRAWGATRRFLWKVRHLGTPRQAPPLHPCCREAMRGRAGCTSRQYRASDGSTWCSAPSSTAPASVSRGVRAPTQAAVPPQRGRHLPQHLLLRRRCRPRRRRRQDLIPRPCARDCRRAPKRPHRFQHQQRLRWGQLAPARPAQPHRRRPETHRATSLPEHRRGGRNCGA
mmetsp:Transcript_11742/g.41117  ORF Transcript_11742/g.41117 Transcript_11742/m.41117 type:complete len:233 (+) Transcript_11742:1562-2260(+)